MRRPRVLALATRPFRLLGRRVTIGLALGLPFALLALLVGHAADRATSTDAFCASCHVHPQATSSWKMSSHYGPSSGVVVHCVECHLPPEAPAYFVEKIKRGTIDLYGKLLTDTSAIDWQERSSLQAAAAHTFEAACRGCHQNLFPLKLSRKGEEAHLHYTENQRELRCINCHLSVGHYDPRAAGRAKAAWFATPRRSGSQQRAVFTEPASVEVFESFTEKIPGTTVAFDMVAIPGGEFLMGSPAGEPYRRPDEGPRHKVRLSAFFMGKIEVTWNEYQAFYARTASEGRSDTRSSERHGAGLQSEGPAYAGSPVDAISGATPPYGNPDQGWGRDRRPAITMTHHAASVYCRWLSLVTGKRYRLPSEAEWEYACRAGTDSAYFFEGSPRSFTMERFWNRIFGIDLNGISPYAIFDANGGNKTHPPGAVHPNAFGLINMPGNVREFCLDYYSPTFYSEAAALNPRGPDSGEEHVIRGGSFACDAVELRSAARDHARHDAWLATDPQLPKSVWWYSDCRDVGFRVVCEWPVDR